MHELRNDFLTSYFIRRGKLIEIYLTILFKKAIRKSTVHIKYQYFIKRTLSANVQNPYNLKFPRRFSNSVMVCHVFL